MRQSQTENLTLRRLYKRRTMPPPKDFVKTSFDEIFLFLPLPSTLQSKNSYSNHVLQMYYFISVGISGNLHTSLYLFLMYPKQSILVYKTANPCKLHSFYSLYNRSIVSASQHVLHIITLKTSFRQKIFCRTGLTLCHQE